MRGSSSGRGLQGPLHLQAILMWDFTFLAHLMPIPCDQPQRKPAQPTQVSLPHL